MLAPEEFWVIVTCKGRRDHLRFTAPSVIEQNACRYLLVDYSCPQQSGKWLEEKYPGRVAEGGLSVCRVPGEEYFHKTRALNLGAQTARERGARVLCFADADTLFLPGSVSVLRSSYQPGSFFIVGRNPRGRSARSLTGVVMVGSDEFWACGGYDERFRSWGSEDIAMRLRFHLVGKLSASELPPKLFHAIPHSNRLRTEFSAEKDLGRSALRGEQLLEQCSLEWTGCSLKDLEPSARRLLFQR